MCSAIPFRLTTSRLHWHDQQRQRVERAAAAQSVILATVAPWKGQLLHLQLTTRRLPEQA